MESSIISTIKVRNCSVPSQLRVKIHWKSPAAMGFWLVCLGILAFSCQNTSRDSGFWIVTFIYYKREQNACKNTCVLFPPLPQIVNMIAYSFPFFNPFSINFFPKITGLPVFNLPYFRLFSVFSRVEFCYSGNADINLLNFIPGSPSYNSIQR